MRSESSADASRFILLVGCASLILMITMGIRQSLGLFISPINTSTGLGITAISLALAIGQFVWGAVQPVFGAWADRSGPKVALISGAFLLAGGLILAPLVPTEWGLIVSLGLLSAAGAGAASFSILIGALSAHVPARRRSFVSGFINGGASLGQFVFAPISQFLISVVGWMNAMTWLAGFALLTLPLSRPIIQRYQTATRTTALVAEDSGGLSRQIKQAFCDRSYWCLLAGFFTCGFHIAFLTTHLPGEVNLCGLPAVVSANSLAIVGIANIFGSLGVGVLCARFRMKWLLFGIYAARAIMIGIYIMVPKTTITFYILAVGLGMTWLATVPPTSGLVGKLFGTRYLGTLFGFTLLAHQMGAFLGAWLGGYAVVQFGDYTWMWYLDILLASLAAFVNIPIREQNHEA